MAPWPWRARPRNAAPVRRPAPPKSAWRRVVVVICRPPREGSLPSRWPQFRKCPRAPLLTGPSSGCAGTAARLLVISARPDDALLEQHATVDARLARGHDGEGLLGTLVEGEALELAELDPAVLRLGQDAGIFGAHFRLRVGVAHELDPQRRVGHKVVERHHREDRLEQPRP